MRKPAKTLITNSKKAQKQFQQSADDISKKRNQLLVISKDLQNEVDRAFQNTPPVAKELLQTIHQTIQTSLQQVDQDIKSERFIMRFENSLIALVAGKVNAGKSSLGNLISGYYHNLILKDASPYQQEKIPFYRHQNANERELRAPERLSEGCFKVKETECTASIQEFTLGGLTWVDTPGLHSLTEENQALAREYIQAAEIVLYLTNSDSPLPNCDVQELRKLGLEKNKRLIIIVSRCDTTDEVWNEEKGDFETVFIPKSGESKQQQQKWIQENIKENGLLDIMEKVEAYLLSVNAAKRAIKENKPELWEASGAEKIYQLLSEIMSDRAVALKQKAPQDRFNALISAIAESPLESNDPRIKQNNTLNLQLTIQEVQKLQETVQRKKALLRGLRSNIEPAVSYQVQSAVLPLLHNLNRSTNMPKLQADIHQKLEKIFQAEVGKHLNPILQDLFDASVQTANTISSFSLRPSEIKEITQKVTNDDAVQKKRIGGGAGAIIGGVLGNMILPGFGGFIGGILGSFFGAKAGKAMKTVRTKTITLGDNSAEVKQELLSSLKAQIPALVNKAIEEIEREHFDSLLHALTNLENALKKAQQQALQLKY